MHNSGILSTTIYQRNVSEIPSGAYFYKIKGRYEITGKIVIIKQGEKGEKIYFKIK
ncbi:hypothetical protein KAW18_15285 [candidate division WOR-3 bacterium]|nr:hypothetical protein [candidate division WOR-3 bacterium]